MKRNSGYTNRDDGTAISLRAYWAEEDGKYTAGKFRTQYGISKSAFEMLVHIRVIVTKEWHHTGKSFTQNDYYEWEDKDFDNAYHDTYDKHKDEINILAKEYAKAEWKWDHNRRYSRYIISFEDWLMQLPTDGLLTDEEKEAKRRQHLEISNAGSALGSAHDRYIMHANIDNRYAEMAHSRYSEEQLHEMYNDTMKDKVIEAKIVKELNDTIKDNNLKTDGKESLLMKLAAMFDIPKDKAYETIFFVRQEIVMAEKVAQDMLQRKEREERMAAINDEIRKKQKTYLDKCIKEGRAERVSRQKDCDTSLMVCIEEEMNGKYGWFKANRMYNMDVYVSGYRMKDKRTYNHYQSISAKVFANIEEPQP